jgi:polysaccharide biosynthesis protein PslH
MRTLFISPLVPYPLNCGSHQRIFHLLRAVAAMSDVTFVFPHESNDIETEAAPIRAFVANVRSFSVRSYAFQKDVRLPKIVQSAKAKWRYLHPSEPALLQWVASSEGQQLVAELCQDRFDLIWGEKLRAVRLLPPGISSRIIIDLDDLEYRKIGRGLRQRDVYPSMPFDVLEYLRLRALERGLVRSPYELLVCSEIDRQSLGGGSRVHVVPNGSEAPWMNGDRRPSASPVFVYVGHMGYPPNGDAVSFFARKIFPRIKQRLPRARFMIVGRDPDAAVRALHNDSDIVVTGTVPRVEPYLRDATALVVPLRFASGTRIKILEALANRVPVVTTPIGAEGLDVEHGRHVLIAVSPSDFANACVRLFEVPLLGEQLGDAGLALVKAYDWESIEAKVSELVLAGAPSNDLPETSRRGSR